MKIALMSICQKIAFLIYLLNAIAMLAIGAIYQFSDEFMPYHSDIIQMSWRELTENQRILYIGMMRTKAAGFLASSVAILYLLLIPYRTGARWATYAIATVGIIEYLPSAIATHHVSQVTSASPPWQMLSAGIGLLTAALVLSLFGKSRVN